MRRRVSRLVSFAAWTAAVSAALLAPRAAEAAKIFVNASDQTTNPVACGGNEAQYAADMGQRAQARLQAYGFDAHYSQDFTNSPAIANNWGADVFVSIHTNAGGGHGTETLYVSSAGQVLAGHVNDAIVAALKFTDRGLKYRDNLHVLNATAMPAVLTEVLFHDCTTTHSTPIGAMSESCFLVNADGRAISAEAIAQGLCAHFGATCQQGPPPHPVFELRSEIDSVVSQDRDFCTAPGSQGIFDLMAGQTTTQKFYVANTGNEVGYNVNVGLWVEQPYLALHRWDVFDNWSGHSCGQAWCPNDANSNPSNPSHDDPGAAFILVLGAISPGETKRIDVTVEATGFSVGLVDHPDVRLWVKHVDNIYEKGDFWSTDFNNVGNYQTFNGGDLRTWSQTDILAVETCNGRDDNCDGVVDEGCSSDAGVPGDDASEPAADGGVPAEDAGVPGGDSGLAAENAAASSDPAEQVSIGSGFACASTQPVDGAGPARALILLGLILGWRWRRARRLGGMLGCAIALGALLAPRSGAAITRCDAVARAERWVANAVPYSWDAWYTDPSNGQCCYRTDCSALVSISWDLPPPGRTTYHFAGGPWDTGESYVIAAGELQPGDALNYPGDPNAGTGHVMLYISGDFNSGWVEVIEEYNFGQVAEHRWRSINPGLYLPIRYVGIEPCNRQPRGWLDAADGTSIRGWAQDADTPDASIDVHFYFDGPALQAPWPALVVNAGQQRDDLCTAIGSCNHGFMLPTPLRLRDGQPHQVYAYAIDTAGGTNPLLAAAPMSFSAGSAPMPVDAAAGIKRHVVSPEVLVAWHWGTLDIQPVADALLDSYAAGAPLDEGPSLRRGDGDMAVYLIDDNSKRWVTSPSSMAAWRFDSGAIAVVPLDQINALPTGPAMLEAPMLVQGSGPAVYLIDLKPPAPGPAGSDAGTPVGSDAGTPVGSDAGTAPGSDATIPTSPDATSSSGTDARAWVGVDATAPVTADDPVADYEVTTFGCDSGRAGTAASNSWLPLALLGISGIMATRWRSRAWRRRQKI